MDGRRLSDWALRPHGISQAILEGVAISSSRGSSPPRDWTCLTCFSCTAGRFFTAAPPGKPEPEYGWHIPFTPYCSAAMMGGGLVAKSCLTLATPWTAAYQAPLSMGFSRQEYWTGLPLPFPPKRWDGQFCLKMLILIHTSWWRSMWDGKDGLWELGTGGQGSLLPHLSRNSIHSTKERKERIPDFKKLVFYRTVENSNVSPMNKKATTQSRCGQLLELACSFWCN